MAVSARFWAYLACAALAFLGLTLGASLQSEQFLVPDGDNSVQDERSAAGNLVVLTGLLLGLGTMGAALLISTRPLARRFAWSLALGLCAYALAQLMQTAWPNYTAVDLLERAELAVTLLVGNEAATPSVALPFFALVWAALAGTGLAAARLRGPAKRRSLDGLRARHASHLLVATPMLGLAAAGSIRLLLRIPGSGTDSVGYLLVLPLLAAACLALLGIEAWRHWQVAHAAHDSRLRIVALDAWSGTARAGPALALAIAALCLAASFLPAIRMEDLQLGRSLGVTLRGHTQLVAFALLPVLPMLRLQAPTVAALRHDGPHAPLRAGPLLTPLSVAAAVAAGSILTWTADGAMVPWMAMGLLVAAPAFLQLPARLGALPLMMGAAAVWATGNTVVATFDGRRDIALVFDDPVGLLALWRMTAALVGGFALARVLAGIRPHRGAMVLAVVGGVALAVVGLYELSLHAWMVYTPQGQSIAVGSFPASQEAAVRFLLEAGAAGLSVASATVLARVWRPDWFGKRADPAAAPQPTTGPSRTTAATT